MNDLAQPPMRNEDDLRAALAALESRAPSADAVLRAVRERTGPSRRPGLARAPRWRHLAAVAVAVAAVTGLVVALLPGGPRTGSGPAPASNPGAGLVPAPTAQGGLPSAASVGKSMVSAFSTANDDILYTEQTGVNHGVTVDIYQDWGMPAQPVTGQPERSRVLYSQRMTKTAPLLISEDDGFDYVTPPAGTLNVNGKLIVVCYGGTGQTGCGYGHTETPPGTWALYHGRFLNINPGLNDLSPASLARAIAAGQWRVIGRTHLDGQPALALRETPKGIYRPPPVYLWVNAHSYLPLRMVQGGGTSYAVNTWSFLKPTPANLNLLNVPIPPGYPRSNSTGS